MSENIPLPRTARAIAAAYPSFAPISYAALYRAALDGRIPVIQGLNGRYFIERANLAEIARSLGLTPPASQKTAL